MNAAWTWDLSCYFPDFDSDERRQFEAALAKELAALTLEELKRFSPLFEVDLFDAIALETVVNRRNSRGGTGGDAVRAQMEKMASSIEQAEGWVAEKAAVVSRRPAL